MYGRKHTGLLALGLSVLFLVSLVPADLLHDHGHEAAHLEFPVDDEAIEVDCSICDMVVPIQSEAAGAFHVFIRSLTPDLAFQTVPVILEGDGAFPSDRGPPILI